MFTEYIDNKIVKLKNEEAELQNADRKDEANFAKIKINICEICKTLYNVSQKEPDGQNAREFFLQKLDKLSLEWKASLEKAKEFDDIEKTVIEEIKLEILEEIRKKYTEVSGDLYSVY